MLFETGHNLVHTRTAFLRIVSGCYAIAFLSIYLQMEGLYGDNGILPIKNQAKGYHFQTFFQDSSLIWIRKVIRISSLESVELIGLLGTLVGFMGAVWKPWLNKASFGFMFLAYLTVFKVAQTFMWFQWDILLLEVGFICILVAPFNGRTWYLPRPRDHLSMMLVRWLLFRMMYANGVVKLQSGCPTWWGLTAMPLHYESQCIPTYLAWFAYNAPLGELLHKLSVAVTFITEIPMTFLFYHPCKAVRKLAFWLQVLLMVVIMLTGNYNFFNFLYISLCISLLDDSDFESHKIQSQQPPKESRLLKSLGHLNTIVTMAALAFASYKCFYDPVKGQLKVTFSRTDFDKFVSDATPVGLALGALSMCLAFVASVLKAAWPQDTPSRLTKSLTHFLSLVVHSVLALGLFAISVPVFLRGIGQQSIIAEEPNLRQFLPIVDTLSSATHQLNLVHSYGLFRTMTGVGGRPEIVIEGADVIEGPWKEYHFLYKPGNVSEPLRPFVLPHQPRLDWQMWFAALGTYQHNPWLISLVYRILQNKKSVLKLIDEEKIPEDFRTTPPKVMRITKFKYHFTGPTNAGGGAVDGGGDWWYRDGKEEYLFPVSADNLEEYLRNAGVLTTSAKSSKKSATKKQNGNWISRSLTQLREFHQTFKPHFIVQQVFLGMVALPFLL